MAERLEQDVGIWKEEGEIRRINRIGLSLASAIQSPLPLSFNILNLPEANALAVPGGFIYLTRGMVELKLTDGEMAFLLGHEIAHLEKGHLYQMRKIKSLLDSLLLGVGITAMRKAKTAEEIKATQAIISLSQLLMERKYSRTQEKEADYWGRVYALRAGYPDEAGKLFEKIDFWKERRPDLMHILLSTHPYLEERKKAVIGGLENLKFPPIEEERRRKKGEEIQKFLWKEMDKIKDKKGRRIVLRNLYQILPSSNLAGEALYLLYLEEERETFKLKERDRDYGKLIRKLEEIKRTYTELKERREIEKKIKKLTALYEENKRWFEERIGKVDQPGFYQKFLKFFPDSSRREEALFQLFSLYRDSGKYSLALSCLLKLMDKGKEWREKGEKWGKEILSKVGESYPLFQFYMRVPSPKVKEILLSRLSKEEDLKTLRKIQEETLEEEIKKVAERRVKEVTENLYHRARMEESMGNQSRARELFSLILDYAPESIEAKRIREDLKRKEFLREKGGQSEGTGYWERWAGACSGVENRWK